MQLWEHSQGPLLYAHRGASRECPENTLLAFECARACGADVFELDVHPTRDGIFVVSHDPTGLRVAGVARAIADSTWAEVSSWDAGFGFQDATGARPFAGKGIRPLCFDQVLEAFPDVPVNVDVKEATPPELERLVGLLREARAEERVLLTSFSHRVLAPLRRLTYRGPLGLSRLDAVRLVFSPVLLSKLIPFGGSRAQVPTRSGPKDLATPRIVAKCRALGLALDYWVINDPVEAARLLDLGADGLFTDDPRAIAEVFKISPRTAAWRKRHASDR
jgi:glycerophosphoryl diester phosphodiesterase